MSNNTPSAKELQPLSCAIGLDDPERRLTNALTRQLKCAQAYPEAVLKILSDRPDLHPNPQAARRALRECARLVGTVLAQLNEVEG